jgi:hypothetical protein
LATGIIGVAVSTLGCITPAFHLTRGDRHISGSAG